MTAPCLYVSSKGIPWRKHSYSAGNDFEQSAYKYYLKRVLGWRERDNKARFEFGKALETAIQYHHEHDGVGAVDEFIRQWSVHKDNGNLSYTDTEKNWDTLLKMGSDMVKLYIAIQPKLPVPLGGRSVFQREYEKEMFPGDVNYGGISDAGRLDIIAYADPDHPMLPKVERKAEHGPYRAVIVDIKTAAQDFPEQPGMAGFDSQLKRYSFLTGIRTVALLWFVKKGLGHKKGYSISFLERTGAFEPGDEGVIAKVEDDHAHVVKNDFMLAEMDRIQGKKGEKLDQTDAAKERAQTWLEQYGVKAPLTAITKQRLQWNSGLVSEKSANEAGQVAARQIVGIVNAWKNQEWPDTFGIRYPRNDLNDSYFRAFVLNDEAYKKQNFTKSNSTDDLFNDENDNL